MNVDGSSFFSKPITKFSTNLAAQRNRCLAFESKLEPVPQKRAIIYSFWRRTKSKTYVIETDQCGSQKSTSMPVTFKHLLDLWTKFSATEEISYKSSQADHGAQFPKKKTSIGGPVAQIIRLLWQLNIVFHVFAHFAYGLLKLLRSMEIIVDIIIIVSILVHFFGE